MTPRDLARNKRVIFYISGFCLLGILLTFTLRDMYVTFRTRITREVAQQQILAVRSISHALEDDLDSIIEDLRESSKYLTGSHSHVGVLETAVKSFFFKEKATEDLEEGAFDSSIISVRWLDESGNERTRIAMNGRPASTTDTLKASLGFRPPAKRPGPRVIGPIQAADGTRILWVTVPVAGKGRSSESGTLAAEVDFDRLVRGEYHPAPGEVPDIFILNEHGSLIFSLERPDMYGNNVLENDPECTQCHENFDLPRSMAGGGEGWSTWKTPDKSEYVAFTPLMLGDLRCSIALAVPSRSLESAIGRFQAHFSAVILLILGLFGLIASLIFDLRKKRLVAEEKARHLQRRAALLRENKEKDKRYFELVEGAKDSIYILQGDRFVFVNKAFERLHGYSRDELISPDFDLMGLVSPEYRDYIRERGERLARGEALEPTYEFRIVRKDGRKVDVEANVTYIKYRGKPAVQGILRDISERKRIEGQKELMLELSDTIRNSMDIKELATKAFDYTTRTLDLRAGALYIYDEKGKELRLVAHKGIRDENLPLQRAYRLDAGERGVAVRTALRREVIIVDDMAEDKRLDYIPSQASLQGESLISFPLLSQDLLLGVIQFIKERREADWERDISFIRQVVDTIAVGLHRKRILTELRDSEQRLKHLFENTKEVIYIITSAGRIKILNKAGIELFAPRGSEDLNDIDIMQTWKARIGRQEFLERIERDGFIKDLEMKYLCRDGKVHTFIESAVAMRDEEGKTVEYQGIMTDITTLNEAQEEMREKNAELERANTELRELDRLKGNFISTISHELRTPLTSIKASVDMLLKGMLGDLDEKKQGVLSICRRNSDRLMMLVNDLLEIQNLESGRNRLELRPLNFDDLIPKVVERALKTCEKKDIRLLTRISPDKNGRIILGDPAKISHALFNLISNAIKFSDKGTIQIELEYRDSEVQLSVSDEGVGIPDEMKEKIFDRFTQVDNGMTRERGGTGLGLALARTIVEKHGGRIWVESQQGKGSRFTFSLPCRETGEGDRGQDGRAGGRN